MKSNYYKYTYIHTNYDYNFRKYACEKMHKYIHTKNNGGPPIPMCQTKASCIPVPGPSRESQGA